MLKNKATVEISSSKAKKKIVSLVVLGTKTLVFVKILIGILLDKISSLTMAINSMQQCLLSAFLLYFFNLFTILLDIEDFKLTKSLLYLLQFLFLSFLNYYLFKLLNVLCLI